MKLNRTLYKIYLSFILLLLGIYSNAQVCSLTATTAVTESKCKATGSIVVNAANGSGNYNYTVTGPAYNSTTSSNSIGGLQAGVYTVTVKDIVSGCTLNLDSVMVPGIYQDPRFTLNVTDISCSGGTDGSITVANLQFGKPPFTFSIAAPSASGVGTSNATGVFTGLIAGNYTIQLSDSCGGMQTRIVTLVNHTWSVTATTVTKVNCDSTNVTLTVTDNSGNVNTAPGNSFSGYLYGYVRGAGDTVWSASPQFGFPKGTNRSASFVVKDPCGNVVVTNWTDNKVPDVNAAVSISNKLCNTFTASIKGQQNLSNPQYCLYDAGNVLQTCNTSGVFNNLPYGSYCIGITDTCYDTSFTRCFTVVQPLPNVSGVNISNKGCDSFTATINTGNVNNGNYCIYDVNGVLIACNSTGIFNGLAYGSYCVNVKNDPACYDTTVITCFTVSKPVPAVTSNVNITRTCGAFTADVTGEQNLTNPQYCLYDNSNTLITCNTTGQFTGLAFGDYCIHIINDSTCYDTTIIKCFTVNAVPVSISTSANPSCTIGATDVRITLSNGVPPYTVNIYDPNDVLVFSTSTSSTSIHANNLPGLGAGLKYKVVVAGNCGSLDSTTFTPRISSLTKNINVNAKCPGGVWQNGSGDLTLSAIFSEGRVTPTLIKRDATTINVPYSTKSGNNYTFSNLQPGVYVIQYDLENCSNNVYDTFTLKQYDFPSLSQSSVFQCNNNSFNVNAAATGGINPYTYEIIGSTPASPSIIQGPQASPAFTINNGTTYSVVRLRAIDACGNATINDASILPLGNTVITASSDCFYNNVNLSVDTIPGAVYSWYKKTSATDSVLVGTGSVFNIAYMLPTDTGTYINVASVNGGCLTKIASFNVTGACGGLLLAADGIAFEGLLQKEYTQLKWTTDKTFDAGKFLIQRSTDGIHFTQIGTTNAYASATGANQYFFTDLNTPPGKSYYRLAIVKQNTVQVFTKLIEINKNTLASVKLVTNPVKDVFTLSFNHVKAGRYSISLVNAAGSLVMKSTCQVVTNDKKTFQRPAALAAGVYYLQVQNTAGDEPQTIKIIFK